SHMVVIGAGDVAGAARAGAMAIERLVHGRDHLRVLAHAEIVVGAPDGDVADGIGRMTQGCGEGAGRAFEFGEDAVTTLLAQGVQLRGKKGFEVHGSFLASMRSFKAYQARV